ncbi:hypothetical protein LAC81_34600 (plasmid) [Ensifer adhaerens]|uniref:tetratricopeptide repeat protein n=1 Tax=Ensifer adhaerens TaxID=106592 RepID=UPI001CBB2E4C|nr:hypothetical protein [Ensifer adhaerens]MBZ7927090.1 hypothetical protein [Ensifer adhaerens]UAX98135.1 hypothetical protein LAC78_35900 [Ensifer adhaerens]UAY05516.1 hypothetical protein LAC80_34605 [Ensifer adhaerens]UAY12894.1 hypothetical protein LAC81_34600 [Ensifer adhaerens]
MNAGDASQTVSSAVTESEARAALERMLADTQFRATERHRKLLCYLVDEFFAGRSRGVKAYSIAIDVFGRPTSFDPASDPIVRVEVSRLRAALAQYYGTSSEEVRVRIELPKGNYVPSFVGSDAPSPDPSTTVTAPTNTESEPEEPPYVAPDVAQPKRRPFGLISVAIAGAAAMAGAFYLSVVEAPPWQPVFSAKPTIVVEVAAGGGTGKSQRQAADQLVHVLSQFSSLRTLTQAPMAGIDAASQGGNGYRLSVAYSTDATEHQVSWQVVDAQSNEALRSGTAKATLDNGDARTVQERLLARLARSLAGEEGVIVSLEAARQLAEPSIGYGCVLLADIAMARFDPEGLASAHACLEKSVSYRATDPEVLASLAMVLVATGEARSSLTEAARAVKLADRAVALAPQSSQSYVAQMQARFVAGDTEAAFVSGRRAAALNPLNEAISARLGLLLFINGQYAEGVRLAQVAETDFEFFHRDAALTLALEDYRNRAYREALKRARQLARPNDTAVSVLRIAAAGQLDLTREATSALDRLRWNKGSSPHSTKTELTALGYTSELIELLDDGLAKSGLRLASLP